MLDTLTRRITGVFKGLRGKGRLSEDDVNAALREVRIALLEADVNLKIAKGFINAIKEKAVGQEIYGELNAEQTLIKIVREELEALLGTAVPVTWSPAPPTVVLMVGLQGSGKTTTTAKLARLLQKEGKKVMLAACDVQRPAAIEQLRVLGKQVDCEVYTEDDNKDPVKIAKAALARAKHMFSDVLIVDTAGRLTIDQDLMMELGRIRDVVKPTEVLLVLDSTTGQESVKVAEAFHEQFSLTGAIFSKMDGDTRGGAVLSVRAATGVPVRYVGHGEQVETLESFFPDRMAERILGMGDVLGIIEKAEEAFADEDAKGLEAKMKTGKMDFNDLLAQMKMIKKMGPLKNVIKMLPGAAELPEDALDEVDDGQMGKVEAIILSMTPYERTHPDLLNGSRRKRIAIGSGTTPADVNQLMDQLRMMRKSMKQMTQMQKKMKKGGRFGGMRGRRR